MKALLLLLALSSAAFGQILSPIMAGAPAGGAITVTYVSDCTQASGLTLTCTFTAGNALLFGIKWTGAGTLTSVCDDGATCAAGHAFTCVTAASDSNGDSGQACYQLSANGGSTTITATFSGVTSQYSSAALEAHKSSGTWSFDASNQAGAHSNTASNTGAIAAAGSADMVVYFAFLSNVGSTISSPQIGGVTPTEWTNSPLSTFEHFYYRILSAPGSAAGTLTYGTATDWTANGLALKAQ